MMYEFKKTAKKFLVALVEVVIAGLIVYVTERPEFMFLVPLFEAIRNYWKNR